MPQCPQRGRNGYAGRGAAPGMPAVRDGNASQKRSSRDGATSVSKVPPARPGRRRAATLATYRSQGPELGPPPTEASLDVFLPTSSRSHPCVVGSVLNPSSSLRRALPEATSGDPGTRQGARNGGGATGQEDVCCVRRRHDARSTARAHWELVVARGSEQEPIWRPSARRNCPRTCCA